MQILVNRHACMEHEYLRNLSVHRNIEDCSITYNVKMMETSPEDEDFPGKLLHQAALWDNVEFLEDLLSGTQSAFINSLDSWGRTPLHAAAITPHSHCLEILLKAGADANIQCGPRGNSKTALHLSAEHGYDSNIELLLQYGANMLLLEDNGKTAYDLAINNDHEKCCEILKIVTDAKEQSRRNLHKSVRDAYCQGNVQTLDRLLLSLKTDLNIIINMAPNGVDTLLYSACQSNNVEVVELLLKNGADGRYHPVTKYSPLYIACQCGHNEIVRLILNRFPELIRQHTVEHRLPIHACTNSGHYNILELLFSFQYPEHVLRKFSYTINGIEWEYSMPFDVNEKDATGQNILYMACLVGNQKLVETILKFRVNANRVLTNDGTISLPGGNISSASSTTKRRIASGIQTRLMQLNLSNDFVDRNTCNRTLLCPLQLDMYCNHSTETALHAAVKGKHHDIVVLLLKAGANCNQPIKSNQSVNKLSDYALYEDMHLYNSTALMEACVNRDVAMVDFLLGKGASDDDCKALNVAVTNNDEILVTKLLATKSHPDPEYKINQKSLTRNVLTAQLNQFTVVKSAKNLTYSTLLPMVPVMINWHNQRCNLSHIQRQWLIDAALYLNAKKCKSNIKGDIALYAITRLDLSNNCLTHIPIDVFQLQSLRYLNLSQNRINSLPEHQQLCSISNDRQQRKATEYTCSVLEELYVQENQLDYIPAILFRLPTLSILVASNNKLKQLPPDLWTAPKLKELNVSFNLIKELPYSNKVLSHLLLPKTEHDRLSVSSTEDQLSSYVDADDYKTNEKLEYTPEMEISDSTNQNTRVGSFMQMELSKHHIWSKHIQVTEQILLADATATKNYSKLQSLNLAHNLFTCVPPMLSCLAVNLTKLNMAFNSLRSMSHISSYPSTLRQLDLSHNQITCWPNLAQVESTDAATNLICYSSMDSGDREKCTAIMAAANPQSSVCSVRSTILHSLCAHRRHLRLDDLRTLLMADNQFTRIQLTASDYGYFVNMDDDDFEKTFHPGKTGLIYPNLSMLDVSNNLLKEVPVNMYELSNLSVLNISGNVDINDLPPQMGLMTRLWSLNTRGCSLQEPLRSMISSRKYKTMDIIGYLKSVLEDAKPYARMKLMIVGVQGIGKTSLLEQLRMEGVTRKRSEHWAKRMGNKNVNLKTAKGNNISTVGVDIGDWIYEKKIRNQSSHGPVVFRTWDFGGQKEYYTTHQYFLSKRSLYLAVWKISDGLRGINDIMMWLVNIQARAPNSPVLIVGTHYDVVQDISPSVSEEYQRLIRDRFINVMDAEKMGLPRVLDTIEVSCRTRHNIKLLCNMIYDSVFTLRPPGSKQLLLEQKVPATYLALEDIIGHIVTERRINSLDPVLNSDEYKTIVSTEMQQRFNRYFRDLAELHQATLFLHDNGVLLHYEDAALKDLYFLDPQWLCDMLAHVITIREINPFASTGMMRMDDLHLLFRNTTCVGSCDTKDYIVNLLNKFQVALSWDSRTLLIPSLLPSENDLLHSDVYSERLNKFATVNIPLRSRGLAVRNRKITLGSKMSFYRDASAPSKFQSSLCTNQSEEFQQQQYDITSCLSSCPITRLLIMSYFPSGFWSRLISRILADDTIIDIIRSYFILPKQMTQNAHLAKSLDFKAEWILWQTGLQLKYGNLTLFRIRQVLHTSPVQYQQLKFCLKYEGNWHDLNLHNSSVLEIHFPMENLVIKPKIQDVSQLRKSNLKREVIVKATKQSTTQFLALIVDHIDVLLEDWYPMLGTRFVHTSEGKFLVSRLVLCPQCLTHCLENDGQNTDGQHLSSTVVESTGHFAVEPLSLLSDIETDSSFRRENSKGRDGYKSQESYVSEADSGVCPDSRGSSRKTSSEKNPGIRNGFSNANQVYSWMIEECILAACTATKFITCPVHGDLSLDDLAPDTLFSDLHPRYIIQPSSIQRGHLLGRGAFGFVFRGKYLNHGSNTVVNVAMKMLQPIQPDVNAHASAIAAYKAAQSKWDRDPIQYACKSYCTARQELKILLCLRHPNIVPFVGVCRQPLALVLDLAPQGALDLVLRLFRQSGSRLNAYTIQAVVLQVAKAIEYLHRQRIIYRDLKSENVLVWEMPPPFIAYPNKCVRIKLADYGISRLTTPSGTKGFGGTEGFMAPEIMRYNGEEEYTEKVDCFSFGMFIYELLTLRQPFEAHESIKEYILEGGRPPLTLQDTHCPSHFLDLMVLCWSQQPKDRPSASQIVSIASASEFTHLVDVMSLQHDANVLDASVVQSGDMLNGFGNVELWLACANCRLDLVVTTQHGCSLYYTMPLPIRPTAICTVDNMIWVGDYSGHLHAYLSDGTKLFTYALQTGECVQVVSLLYVPMLYRVACTLSNGRLFLLNSKLAPSTPTSAEGSFVMTELGSTTKIHCVCAVAQTKRAHKPEYCELWCGQSHGDIAVYTIKNHIVADQSNLNHHNPKIANRNVGHLISDNDSVWSSIYPGCIVYQWSVNTQSIINKLDCSKLVPCSESLQSISIEEHLSVTNSQVTSLEVLNDALYIGTKWGCVIIAEKDTLRPITIFRPFEEEVNMFVPLIASTNTGNIIHTKNRIPLIATIGRGYRNLLSRYTNISISNEQKSFSPIMSSNPTLYSSSKQNIFLLLWRAEHWTTNYYN